MPVISKTNPVNWGAAINSGLVDWWATLGQPWSTGSTIRNLTGRYPLVNAGATRSDGGGNGIYKNSINFGTGASNGTSDAVINASRLSNSLTLVLDFMATGAGRTGTKIVYIALVGGTTANVAVLWDHTVSAYNGSCFLISSAGSPLTWADTPLTYSRTHLVVTWNGSTYFVYINGKSQGSVANAGYGTVTNTMRLGSYNAVGTTSTFPGVIYSTKLLSRYWSPSEVLRDYTESRLGYPTALNRVSNKVYFFLASGLAANPLRGGGATSNPVWGYIG